MQDPSVRRKQYASISLVAFAVCLILTWFNQLALSTWRASCPRTIHAHIGHAKFHAFPKVVHETGWWTPYVESAARTFHQWYGTKYGWCNPTNRTEVILPEPPEGVAPKGLLYIKSPKTSSSTCAGMNIAISRHVARRLQQQSGSIDGKAEFTQCEHYDQHSFANHNVHLSRKREESLLWTFVRHPSSRDVSYLYFRHVTAKGVNPNHSDVLIDILAAQQSKQTIYIDAGPNMRKAKLKTLFLNPEDAALRIGKHIFEQYDFIGVLERRLESLAVMTLLWDLDPTDVIVMSAKEAVNGFHTTNTDKTMCSPRQAGTNLHPNVQQYLNSSEYKDRHTDFLLYYAADISLDRTIQFLGSQKVLERARLLYQLEQLAEKKCRDQTLFACSANGTRNAKTNCYFHDFGCGHECIDEVMEAYRQGDVSLDG